MLTASADKTARIWHTETGLCSQILSGHSDEVISCAFNYAGNKKRKAFAEIGHGKKKLEFLFIRKWHFLGNAILTTSKDTCKIWR